MREMSLKKQIVKVFVSNGGIFGIQRTSGIAPRDAPAEVKPNDSP
ncbi:MAG: hypothetical protein PHW53_05075 [Patescibacteria group bacterium]|nr:hypothetical protein [Patescibacteria group bacterium]